MILVVVSEIELKRLGFYCHDNDPRRQLSRILNFDWDYAVEEMPHNDLVESLVRYIHT